MTGPIRSKKRNGNRALPRRKTSSSSNNEGQARYAAEANPENFPSSPPMAYSFDPMAMDWSPSQSALPQRPLIESRRQQQQRLRHSSPIRPSDGPHRQAAIQRAEEEALAEEDSEAEDSDDDMSEAEENQAFIREYLSEEDDDADINLDSDYESNEKKGPGRDKSESGPWIDRRNTGRAKETLVRILAGKECIPKQQWSLRRILATLMYHRDDRRLRRQWGQVRSFFCETMMTETDRDGRWPGALRKKDCNSVIDLRFQSEIEKRHGREVQKLCKAPGSAFGMINTAATGEVNKKPLEAIVSQSEMAPLISSMVQSVGPLSRSTTATATHLRSMKQVAIMAILCRSAHRNNSNYLPLLVALYLYSAGARVDAITLLNHFGLSVSYSVLLKSLRGISQFSMDRIKAQSTNQRLVGTWDNFEYRENVNGERIGDKVKFCSVTMALWIKNGWRIPEAGLNQSMWDPQRELLQVVEITDKVFEREGEALRQKCVRSHRFKTFQAAFPDESFSFTSPSKLSASDCASELFMRASNQQPVPKINVIDCKVEGKTEAYAFAPSMHSESSLTGNMGVFEDLVGQMGIEHSDPQWEDRLTLWWGDLKTEILMRSMQAHGKVEDSKRPYHQYRHIFPSLAPWHLKFNYVKMVWELFYPGGSATERSTLQWAADHWHRDKTTKPTDFHSLEDLTIHSYQARVIAMVKPWIQKQKPSLCLHDHKALGPWLSTLTAAQWDEALNWLENRMNDLDPTSAWNDHWRNHVRFCRVMEPYMTLCHAIKHGDTDLLRHALREIAVILQAPEASKPKYAREMLRQIHIFDTKAAHPDLQEAYLANSLVNLRGESNSFYEIDLLLEHQNGEFKRFRSDRGSSLQESDELFRLHALSVDALRNVRSSMNQTVIGHQRKGYHPQKDASFDILSLADHLHRSHSTNPNNLLAGPEIRYFSENNIPDLLRSGKTQLQFAIQAYNKSEYAPAVAKAADGPLRVRELEGQNEEINELFSVAREEASITTNHQGI